MRLSDLVQGLVPAGQDLGADPEVTAATFDSRDVGPGTIFLAVSGAKADGLGFLPGAVAAGAVACVASRRPEVDPGIPVVVVDDVRDVSGALVARLHAAAFEQVGVWAVTGTKGKTTTTQMLAAMLRAGGVPCGTVGTLGWADATGEGGPLANTTPDAARLGEIVAELARRGHGAVAVEASSQAGVQARLRHLAVRGLAFLNLSPEHAELHPTMDAYRAAKAALFAEAAAVVPELWVALPAGDPDAVAMREAAGPRARVLEFGEGGEVDGRVLGGGVTHLDLELALPDGVVRARLGFGGRFNLQNALAAATLAHAAGVPAAAIAAGLEELPTVRGRFEVLERGGVYAMVDYAHSADALEKLLQSCRDVIGAGRVLLVFGCGGKKDPGKRPKMGASAAAHADLAWVTNDNPRGEDPAAIAAMVMAGVPGGAREKLRIELDRRAAIRAALDQARPGDLVVVAGKGHETEQDLGDRVIEFDDRAVIRDLWEGAGR